MPWDPTPWLPGISGAKVSPEVSRNLAYIALGGNEGVGGPGDLKVLPTGVSSEKVRVLPGGGAALNRSAAPDGAQQMYTARLPSEDLVDINPTPLGARSDLVIMRIEDPQYEMWDEPADPATAQFVFTRVIEGVNPATVSARELNLPYPAIALARVDMPSGKSAVELEYIKDLREIAKPQRWPEQRVSGGLAAGTQQDLSATAFARWFTPGQFDIMVPAAASHYTAELEVLNALHTGSNVWGVVGLFAGRTGQAVSLVASLPYAVENNAATTRMPVMKAVTNGDLALPAGQAGKLMRFELYARRDGGAGQLLTDDQTRVLLKVTFSQRAA